MTLRLATFDDAFSIAALSIEVWLGTYLKQGIGHFFAQYALAEFTPQKVASLIADPNQHIIVSDNIDGIDGFIRVANDQIGPVAGCSKTEIATFYVQPRHHGKGIGKTLIGAALKFCKTTGAPSVWLATNAENTPAIGFYLAQEFRFIGHTHFRLHDQAYLNNVYSIDL